MTQAIEKRQEVPEGLAMQLWGRERLAVLKQQIAPGASDAELDLFATVCRRTRLDPFARQIWSIPRRRKATDERGRDYYEQYQVIQIGVHGLRLIAQRSRDYGGQDGPYWCGKDGKWVDAWFKDEAPTAARIGVKRKGWDQWLYSVAVWDRAVQRDNRGQPMALWKTRGPEQLALAAERDALRRAFPIETSEVEVVIDDPEVQAERAQRYDEIFSGDNDVVVSGDRLVDRTTGEVLEPPGDGGAQRAREIVEQAHSAARQREMDLAEVDRQRREEGVI